MLKEYVTTHAYDREFRKIKDNKIKRTIKTRVQKMIAAGKVTGDVRQIKCCISKNIFEFRIPNGAAFRVYCAVKDTTLILLYVGQKSTQMRDVQKLQRIYDRWCITHFYT